MRISQDHVRHVGRKESRGALEEGIARLREKSFVLGFELYSRVGSRSARNLARTLPKCAVADWKSSNAVHAVAASTENRSRSRLCVPCAHSNEPKPNGSHCVLCRHRLRGERGKTRRSCVPSPARFLHQFPSSTMPCTLQSSTASPSAVSKQQHTKSRFCSCWSTHANKWCIGTHIWKLGRTSAVTHVQVPETWQGISACRVQAAACVPNSGSRLTGTARRVHGDLLR